MTLPQCIRTVLPGDTRQFAIGDDDGLSPFVSKLILASTSLAGSEVKAAAPNHATH